MKNMVILLWVLFITLTFPAAAQIQPGALALQDTLILKLQNRNQVYIINRSLQRLTDYQRADSLKNYFFADLEKTLVTNNFPETPKRVYYLVNQTGKRRLKAEIPGETEPVFDLEFEKKRLKQDLPPLHYTIYDLAKSVEIHYFLEDTTAINLAAHTDLNPAVTALKTGKKGFTGLTSYKLEKNNAGWENRTPKRSTNLNVEVFTYMGGMLLGSQPSPLLSGDIFASLGQQPSSGLNHLRLGISYSTFVLTNFKEGKFVNLNPGTYWHGILQSNLGLGKDNWFGVSLGQISTKHDSGLPGKAYKGGLVINQERNSFSFENIRSKLFYVKSDGKEQMYMLTYRRSIL